MNGGQKGNKYGFHDSFFQTHSIFFASYGRFPIPSTEELFYYSESYTVRNATPPDLICQ